MGTPLPAVKLEPVPEELIDDIRAYLAFFAPRKPHGELVIRIPLDGPIIRRWKLDTEENRQREGSVRARRAKDVDTSADTSVDSSRT